MKRLDLAMSGDKITHHAPQNPFACAMHNLKLTLVMNQGVIDEPIQQQQGVFGPLANQHQPGGESLPLDPAADFAASAALGKPARGKGLKLIQRKP